jgi:hypothetical protein
MNARLICNRSSCHMEHVTMSYLAPCRACLLYMASHNQTVKVWKLSDGTCVDTFLAHDGPINTTLINEADHRLDQPSSKLDYHAWILFQITWLQDFSQSWVPSLLLCNSWAHHYPTIICHTTMWLGV